jgi:hypothetical protein
VCGLADSASHAQAPVTARWSGPFPYVGKVSLSPIVGLEFFASLLIRAAAVTDPRPKD